MKTRQGDHDLGGAFHLRWQDDLVLGDGNLNGLPDSSAAMLSAIAEDGKGLPSSHVRNHGCWLRGEVWCPGVMLSTLGGHCT